MKTFLKPFIFSVSILISSSGWSQSVIGQADYLSRGNIIAFDSTDKTAIGTPYVNEDFVAAKISNKENLILLVRYNAIADEIEVKKDDQQIFAFNKALKDVQLELIVEKKTYQLFDYVHPENGSEVSGYFVHLGDAENNIKFLKKEIVAFYKEKAPLSGYDQRKPAQYKRKSDEYYIKVGDNLAEIISKDKKDFAAMFPKHEKKVLDYIKSEKIKLKNDEDFTKLSIFVNLLK